MFLVTVQGWRTARGPIYFPRRIDVIEWAQSVRLGHCGPMNERWLLSPPHISGEAGKAMNHGEPLDPVELLDHIDPLGPVDLDDFERLDHVDPLGPVDLEVECLDHADPLGLVDLDLKCLDNVDLLGPV